MRIPVSVSKNSWICFFSDPFFIEYQYDSIRNFTRAGHGEIQRCKYIYGPLELVEGSGLGVQDLNVDVSCYLSPLFSPFYFTALLFAMVWHYSFRTQI